MGSYTHVVQLKIQYVSTHEFGAADILSRLIANVPKANEDTIIACIQFKDDIKIQIQRFKSLRSYKIPTNW